MNHKHKDLACVWEKKKPTNAYENTRIDNTGLVVFVTYPFKKHVGGSQQL
jgi:hypothetical protein